jgi:hypothetical protein
MSDNHEAREATMAEYLILIYQDEAAAAGTTPEQWAEMIKAHNAFQEAIPGLGGKVLSGNALQPTTTATSVRGDVVTDGPFVETKEALGGYYLVDAPDLDAALAIAKLCPAPVGVEVRPIMDTSGG